MRRSVFITVLLALIIFIGSCGKSKCLNPGLRIMFKDFDSLELSRVLVLQYVSNGGFATVVGVRIFDTANTETRQSNDTVYMPHIDTSGTYILPGYDYVVAVPSIKHSFFADTVFKISKISYTQITKSASKNGNGGCTNDVTYYLDSIAKKVPGGLFTQSNLPPVTIVLNK